MKKFLVILVLGFIFFAGKSYAGVDDVESGPLCSPKIKWGTLTL